MKHLTLLFGIFLSFQVCAQTYLNTTWERYTDKPDTLAWSASATLGTDVVSIGNTYDTTSSTDFSITVTNYLGNEVWSDTYDGGLNGEDYAVDLVVDELNNIFVTGAGHIYNDSTFDIAVLKYNSSGTLQWTATYTASDSLHEYPISIGLDESGNVYVAGSDEDSAGLHDYLLVKWNSSGTFQWAATYDYNGNDDIAGAMAFSKHHITITGGSEDSDSTWDITTVQYDYSGNLDGTPNRQTAADARLDYPKDLVKDENDYYYIAGTAYDTTGKLRGKIIALDDTLGLAWVAYCDSVGESRFNSLTLYNNELYVTGSYINDDGAPHTLTEKYATDGTCQWSEIYFDEEGMSGDGVKVRVEASDVHIASTLAGPTIYNMLYVKYDTAGTYTSDRKFTGIQADIAVATDLDIVDSNTVILSGIVEDANGAQHYRAQYDILEINKGEVTDTTNGDHIEGTLLVSFNPDIVTPTFQDKETQQWEKLSQIIPDSTYDSITAFLNLPGDYEIMCVKAFDILSSTDTMGINNEGDTLLFPSLWATYEVFLPDTISPFTSSDTLNTLWPDINYAEAVYIGKLQGVPNDPVYANTSEPSQKGLKPGTYTLNAENAWDITTGNERTRVCILESEFGADGMNATDFVDEPNFNSSYLVNGSSISFSQRFRYKNLHPARWPFISGDPQSHGTKVTSILLALRDNNHQIAGVAGGGSEVGYHGDQENGIKATIYAAHKITSTDLARALIDNFKTDPDFRCDYFNLSFTLSKPSSAVFDALEWSRHFGVSVIQSHAGNGKSENVYPSSYNDEWSVLVGSIDRANGERLSNSDYKSSYGGSLDVVTTAGKDDLAGIQKKGNSVEGAIGNSFATAAVSGGVGLLYSLLNPADFSMTVNLNQEDIEEILQRTAEDGAGGTPGWDEQTGDGAVKLDAMLEFVRPNTAKILHRSTKNTSQSIMTRIETDKVIEVKYPTQAFMKLAAGEYKADIYEVEFTITNNIPLFHSITDVWARSSVSSFFKLPGHEGFSNRLMPYTAIEVVSYNHTTTTCKGHIYHIKEVKRRGSWVTFNSGQTWYPDPNEQGMMAVTIRAETWPLSTTKTNFSEVFGVFPNPYSLSSGLPLVIEITPNDIIGDDLRVSLTNTTGKVVFQESLAVNPGMRNIQLELPNISAGLYFVSMQGDEYNHTSKLIISE